MIIGDFQSPVSNTCVVEWLVTTQTNTVSKQDFQGAKSIHISLQHSIHGVAILIVPKNSALSNTDCSMHDCQKFEEEDG